MESFKSRMAVPALMGFAFGLAPAQYKITVALGSMIYANYSLGFTLFSLHRSGRLMKEFVAEIGRADPAMAASKAKDDLAQIALVRTLSRRIVELCVAVALAMGLGIAHLAKELSGILFLLMPVLFVCTLVYATKVRSAAKMLSAVTQAAQRVISRSAPLGAAAVDVPTTGFGRREN